MLFVLCCNFMSYWYHFGVNSHKMEFISLEEDYTGINLSQENGSNVTGGGILGDGTDFQLPVVSVVKKHEAHYSDISDDEFTFPSSQRQYQEMQR